MNWQQIPCVKETRPNPKGLVRLGSPDALSWGDYQGKVSCVYLDPPFYTGELYSLNQRVGESGWKTGKRTVKVQAYSDRFEDREAYLSLVRSLAMSARGLLSDEGALFVHVDTRADAHVRLLLDELFNERNFVNQIIWSYQSGGRSVKYFSRKHDVIFFYRKTGKLHFDITHVPIPRDENRSNHMRRTVDENGRPCRTIRSGGKTYVYYDDDPVYPSDVWADVSHLQQKDPQRTGYETQKPVKLLDRVILSGSAPGDLVCDLFSGSGTTLESASLNGRRFLGVDFNAYALQVTRRRLTGRNVIYLAPPCQGEPDVDIAVEPGIAYYDVTLTRYQMEPGVSARTFPGLDAVDSWSVGYLRDGVFLSMAHDVRLRHAPALKRVLQLPVLEGTPCVRVSDVLGRYFYYAFTPEGV